MKTENLNSQRKTPFFDKRFSASILIIIATSTLLVFSVKLTDAIHIPYFVAVLSAIAIGFLEPDKGWALAIAQVVLSLLGYYFIAPAAESSTHQELELFSLYGSIGLTFIASFIGGFLKRALR